MLQPTHKPASTLNTSKVFMDKQSNTYNLQVISNASNSLANISKYKLFLYRLDHSVAVSQLCVV